MQKGKNPTRLASLFRWLFYSVAIPLSIVFLRGLAQLFFYGPDNVNPVGMLSSSEVAFLAAILVAETLGQTPSRRTLDLAPHNLVLIQAFLIILLMLSLMTGGVLAPLETTNVGSSSTSGSATISAWLTTPDGQKFLAGFNFMLLIVVFLMTLGARLLEWTIDRSPTLNDTNAHDKAQVDLSQRCEAPGDSTVSENSEEVIN